MFECRVEIDQIKGQIEEIRSLLVKIHKFRTKDQNEKDGQFRGW
jgi:hypothetical protein